MIAFYNWALVHFKLIKMIPKFYLFNYVKKFQFHESTSRLKTY